MLADPLYSGCAEVPYKALGVVILMALGLP